MNITIDSHQVFPDNTNLNCITYNDIYNSNNPKMLLFLKENPHLLDIDYVVSHKINNIWIADLIIDNIDKINRILLTILSQYNNDKIIIFLINNEKYINWWYFNMNNNNIAVEYLINNPNKIDIMRFSLNTNDKAVEYVLNFRKINNMYNVCSTLSNNSNNKAVEFLLNNPKFIYYSEFSYNTNDIAVEYLIKNINMVYLEKFNLNKNDKAVEYLINNPDKIIATEFLKNTNPKAIHYIKNDADSFIDIYIDQNLDDLDSYGLTSYQEMYDYIYENYIDDL